MRLRLLAGSLADALEEQIQRRADALAPLPTFREFLESPEYCGPYFGTMRLSPAILTIAEASDGRPVTACDDALALKLFRSPIAELPLGYRPQTVVVNAGRRGGKTANLLAPACVHAAWTVPVPNLKPGEIARAVIISSEVDLAEAAFNYCRGIVESSPRLRRAIISITDNQILLRRPDGHEVEIVVGAASRGGTAARSRSLLFVGLDEAAFFYAADGHSVNDQAIYDAALGTVQFIQGAQIWILSTPWVDGSGLMEQLIEKHWGRVNAADSVLVAARISSYELRGVPDDGSLHKGLSEETYRREILSIPLPPGSTAFFPAVQLAAALDAKPPPGAPDERGAGGDFAFENDCSAVACVGRWRGVFAPTLAEERAASPALDSDADGRSGPTDPVAATAIVRELGAALRSAGCRSVMADAHQRQIVTEHLALEGLAFVDAPGGSDGKANTYAALKRLIDEGRFRLGHLPREVAERIRDELRAVLSRPLPGGGFKIYVPRVKRAQDRAGSHGDLVSALVLAAWQAGARNTAAQWDRAPPAKRATAPSSGGMSWLRSRSPGQTDFLRRGR